MKHLNPRQGITTLRWTKGSDTLTSCETPKSPPGDYNQPLGLVSNVSWYWCETPKSPPGDYNVRLPGRQMCDPLAGIECETPKSPPGDYNLRHLPTHSFSQV